MTMEFRNARYIDHKRTLIDAEIKHPGYGWIPITVNQKDYPDLWEQMTKTDLPHLPAGQPDVSDVALEVWRQTAVLSKAEFCLALMRAGILSAAEAKIAAKGEWPETFQNFLQDGVAGMSVDEMEILWAGATQIERYHPLFEEIRKFANMSPKQADQLFGAPA